MEEYGSMAKAKSATSKKPAPAKGRPSKYNADFTPLLAETLASKGLTDRQIAEKLGITESTINKWKIDYPVFSESLKRGKEAPDDMVEASLFKRAIGFENEKAVKIFMPANAGGPVYAPYTEIVHPDVTACIFWLKNRRPDRWRDKQEIEHSGTITDKLTKEERKARIDALKAKLD